MNLPSSLPVTFVPVYRKKKCLFFAHHARTQGVLGKKTGKIVHLLHVSSPRRVENADYSLAQIAVPQPRADALLEPCSRVDLRGLRLFVRRR